MHCKKLQPGDVWRTCSKIRAAVFRTGIDLSEYFKPLDRHNNCLISESQFISVIHGQLGAIIGLSEQEVAELADFFRVPDGRIYYTQLCNLISDSVPQLTQKSELKWEDSMHTNKLSVSEERRLKLIITKIVSLVNRKKFILRPYFQDYELVSKNDGSVTIAHFARIMAYLGILLSAEDFKILVKKYLKDSYTLNYVAFLDSIFKALSYLDSYGILDLSGDIMPLFPGRVTTAELPKLPRPEIENIMASKLFGDNVFAAALEDSKKLAHILTTMSMIQEHVLGNRLIVSAFFKHFDLLNSGRITVSQFHRGLDALALSGKQRVFLSLPDVEAVINKYRDPCDATRVCWKTFEDDINCIFSVKEPPKIEEHSIEFDPSKLGKANWQSENNQIKNFCENAVRKVKEKVIRRRILLKPMFKEYDKNNNGHVSRGQMRQALNMSGILLSEEELFAVEDMFKNDMGFNYVWFLKEVEPKPTDDPLYIKYLESVQKCGTKPVKDPPTRQTRDILQIMAKIKGQVIIQKIRILDIFKGFNRCTENVVSRINFHRALLTCGFELSCDEIETLMEVFASPLQTECIDYLQFAKLLEQSESCVEIATPEQMQIKDCEKNFLNFSERLTLSVAMQKLSKKPDLQLNLASLFRKHDEGNCGTISRTYFLKALSLKGMYNVISNNEFDVICKCFSFERGTREEVDYRAFLKALEILYATDKYNPL